MEDIPVVAVEIVSRSDKQEEIDEKVVEYLDRGMGQVWVVNPRFRTLTVIDPTSKRSSELGALSTVDAPNRRTIAPILATRD